MDANNDGQLSYEEFSAAMQTDKFLVDALLKPTNDEGPAEGDPGWNMRCLKTIYAHFCYHILDNLGWGFFFFFFFLQNYFFVDFSSG